MDINVLNQNRKLQANNVCYTCITGDYDTLKNPTIISKGFDYICFTDNPNNLISDVWEIRPIPDKFNLNISDVKKQKLIKWRPDLLFDQYENSIWVDGNIQIKCDLNKYLTDNLISIIKHPERNDIYQEGAACIRLQKDSPEIINKQLEKYEKLQFPKCSGLAEANFIIRKHNNPLIKELGEKMEKELLEFSHRDQLSFNYVVSTIPGLSINYLDKNTIRNSRDFELKKHKLKIKY